MKKKTLKELRESKKMTQEQLSKELSITKEYLSMLERGERNPSDKLKKKIANFFNVSKAYIFLILNETNSFNSEINTGKTKRNV